MKAQPTAKPQATRRTFFVGSAFLLLAVVGVYSRAITNGFIWDDPQHITNNVTLRSLDGLRMMWLEPTSLPQWYPLVHTTFWIEHEIAGNNPLLYHLDNILLHALSSILIWRLLRKLEVPGAFFAACVFAVHPVMVESVAWITERKNVLSLVFYLLAMWVYLFESGFGCRVSGIGEMQGNSLPDTRHPSPDTRSYSLAFALFLAAILSKSVTGSLPAAVLVILWWKNGRLRLRDFLPLIPFFVAALAMGFVTGYLEKHHVGASGETMKEFDLHFDQRCLIAGRAIWFYLGKLLWPHPLVFIYPRWNEIDTPTVLQWGFPALVVAATAALFFLRRRLGRGPLAAWLLFCGTLFPALGFVNVFPMRYSFVADHFQYHATIAMIALFAAGTSKFPPRMRGVIWGAVLVILGVLTFRQTLIYKDAETLWLETLKRNPDSWMVNTNVANALVAQKRFDEAFPFYEKSLKLAPQVDETNLDYGISLMQQGKTDEAEMYLNKALAIDPLLTPAIQGLGQLYFYNRKDPVGALEYYRKALAQSPNYFDANYYYGVAMEQQADAMIRKFAQSKNQDDAHAAASALDDAIKHYRTAASVSPDNRDAHYNLATCLMNLGQFDEAIANLQEALRIDPNDPEAWTNLGNAFFQTHRFNESADAFGKALAINPNLIPAQRGLQAAKSRLTLTLP